jgi:hypothetical protein
MSRTEAINTSLKKFENWRRGGKSKEKEEQEEKYAKRLY